MKRRVIIDLVTEVEENEPPTLLYNDIRQELRSCWHDVSFTMKHEDIDEPQTEEEKVREVVRGFMNIVNDMRNPTEEEQDSVNKYIESISKPTGVNIFDLMDEPQTETEIAKAIVHKMIDDAVIAEDAYPDLRQRMHDAVDEYEPQTDCAWRGDV